MISPLAVALAATHFVASAPAAARAMPAVPQVSQPVVQPVPARSSTLDAALARLARDPRDIDALIDAGNAALALGDVDAATGFFRRADQVSPGNPRVKAGLAGAMVHNDDPFDAIPLFDEAAKAGALEPALVADRGLAYDLVGDSATAQRYYREAQARAPNEEVVRRLALSLAISGDGPGSEALLLPFLRQRDLAAWRTRTFSLAILGDTEQAVRVANTILPADLAAGVAPYLRYMPRLTRAQQAAAANFGNFPRAADIGRDDPRVAQYAPRLADATLVPQGEPLGRKSRARDRSRTHRQEEARSAALAAVAPAPAAPGQAPVARVALAEPQSAPREAIVPAPGPALVPAATSAPAPWTAPAAPLPPVSPAPVPPISASPPAPPLSAPPPPPVPMVAPPVALPRRAPPLPPVPRGLAEAFAEFQRPSIDATPVAGAVDLRRIKPARPKPEKPPEPPPPSHPSRIWVQVATGRDKGALGFDWRRMTREAAEVFHGKQPSVSAWGQTNRLLTGPFQSEAAANSFIAQLRKADIDGAFVWTSPAGQVVDALPEASVRR